MTIARPRPFGPRRFALVVVLSWVLAAVSAGPSSAAALTSKPWAPPADSLVRMATSAKLRFKQQKADSISSDDYESYEIVSEMGRKLLAGLGRNNWTRALAIQASLDSLGLDVEVRTDPALPNMAFMMIRNPFRPGADGVGFIYWLRQSDVRMQGASYPPSQDFSVRFWSTSRPESPYEAVTIYRARKDGRMTMRFYRMDEAGHYWTLVQYEGHGPEFDAGTQVTFTDVNRDGLPEIVAFRAAYVDSFLTIPTDAPQIVEEEIYTERPEGFVLHDARVVPGPSETVRMFSELLVKHESDLARRLMVDPARLDSVLALGWGQYSRPGDWKIEYGEAEPWPEWLELRIRQDHGFGHWLFHFYIKDGRWVILNWIPEKPPSQDNVVHKRAPFPAAPPTPSATAPAPEKRKTP